MVCVPTSTYCGHLVAVHWYQFTYKILTSVMNMNISAVFKDNRWWILIKTHTAAFIGALVYGEDGGEDSGLGGGISGGHMSDTSRAWG